MEKSSGRALVFAVWLFLAAISPAASGQVATTGLPPFGSFASDSFSAVNLANLNVHFEIPIRSLPGRGIPVNARLVTDSDTLGLPGSLSGAGSAIGWPGTGTFGEGATSGGSFATVGIAPGYVGSQATTTSCSVIGGTNYGNYTVYSNFYYLDAHDTPHYFPSGTGGLQVASYLSGTNTPCPYYNYPANPQVTGYAQDGSAYEIFLTSGSGAPGAYVIDNSNGVKNDAIDANGNQNVYSGTTLTDSSGNIALTTSFAAGSTTFSYMGADGDAKNVVVNLESVSITGKIGCTGVQDPGPATVSRASTIALPDGTSYVFTYDPVLGRPEAITLPTGGQIVYTYNGPNNGVSCVDGGTSGFTKQTPDGTWTYARSYSSSTGLWTTTVTDPQSNQTVYTFGNGSGYLILGGHAAQYEVQRVENQLINGKQVPLRTTVTCYNGNFTNCATAVFPTAAANGTVQTVSQKDIYTYLPGVSAPSLSEIHYQYSNLVTEDKEYDFGATFPPGTNFIRDRKISYQAYNCPLNDTTVNSAGAIVAETTYKCDAYGHPTSVSQLTGGSTFVTTGHTYYSTGLLETTTPPVGYSTTYVYNDCNNSFLTKTTVGSLSTSMTWNCTGEVPASSTDANQNLTSFSYEDSSGVGDPFWRVKSTTSHVGQTTVAAMTGYTYNDTASPPSVVTTVQMNAAGVNEASTVNFDSQGRTSSTVAANGAITTTTYDSVGRVHSVSNPHLTQQDATYGLTTYTYDALGRIIQQAQPDGVNSLYWCFENTSGSKCSTNASATNKSAAWTDATDESGNHSQRTYDGLGRITGVMEPNASNALALETDYAYDPLDDLVTVNQRGASGETARTRTFTYDSLSRLVTATNPEAGTVCYGTYSAGTCGNGYDGNGNLLSKVDARGITLSYKYDGYNRMTSKTSSDGSFNYAYLYDGSDGNSETNPLGRLTFISNSANAGQTFFYDSLGRVVKSTYCVPQDCSYDTTVLASYDMVGHLTSLTYPDTRVITQSYAASGLLSSLTYGSNTNYLTASAAGDYDAAGHLVSAVMGNGVQFTSAYNKREAVDSLGYALGSQKLWSKQYTWYPNGNLQLITDGISGVQREFTYDPLNRLLTAQDLAGTSGSSGETVASSEETEDNVLVTGNEIWSSASATITPNAAAAPDGTETATTVSVTSGTADNWSQAGVVNLSLYNAATLTGTVWLRVPSGTLSTAFYIIESGDAGWAVAGQTAVTLTTTWQKFTVTSGTLQNGLTGLNLQVGGGHTITGGAVYDIWGAELSPVSASGTVTNILPASQQYTASSWYPNGVAVSSTTVAAPDGSATAGALTAPSSSTGGTMSDVVENPAQYSSQPVTASVYLRVPSGTMNIGLYIGNTGSSGFNLIGVSNVVANTSWQRFSVTGTTGASTSLLYLQIGGGSPGSIPANQTLDIWGVQMVVGSSPDGYIETQNTTTVTGTSQTLAANGLNESYSYDGFGNIQESGNWSFQQAYTPSNQLSGWSYDAAGNLLTDALGNNYVYDGEGKIKTAAGVNYVYTAEGERVEKSSPLTDTVYFGGRPIARLAGGIWTDLVYGPNGLLLEVPAGGLPSYRMTDHLGSVVGTLNSTGAVVSTQDLGPFGEIFSGGSTDPFVFTGKERDTESGLDYFGARYYASSMGRFLSPDWSRLPVAVPYADISNPQSLNLYSYVKNNPLSHVDADGHVQLCGPTTSSTDANGDTVVNANCVDLPDPPTRLQTMQNWYKSTVVDPSNARIAAHAPPPSASKNNFGAEEILQAMMAVAGAGRISSKYDTSITKSGSVTNVDTDVTVKEAGENLEANGYTKSTASDGTPLYTKGDTQYSIYSQAKSTGGPTAQVSIDGQVVAKIRLQP